MSGGASALLTQPADGMSLEEKQALNRALLKSGAPIGIMNKVRKSLSAIKGGRLAAAIAPARSVTYLISDVPGTIPAPSAPAPPFRGLRPRGRAGPHAALRDSGDAAQEAIIRANTVSGDPLPTVRGAH